MSKYTKEVLIEIIKKNNCKTTTELRKVNEYAYKKAIENNWLVELGLAINKHEDGYWTEENVWAVANMYTTKFEFSIHEPVAYKWASKYQILDKMNWMRCLTYNERCNNCDSEVYAYIDEEKKVAYVGLSVDAEHRKKTHKSQKNSAVRKYFGKNPPEPIILKTRLTIDESTYWEDYYKKSYLKAGFRILNIAPTGINTGSIGGIPKWSSKDSVFEESHKYKSRSEFKRKSGGAYNHALSNGWLDEMTWLTVPPRTIKWTREKVFEESRKYEYRGEFCNNSPQAYKVARKNNWLEEMIWLKSKRKPANYWTKEKVFKESRKYTNRKDFDTNAKTAFSIANKKKWLSEMIWLKPLPLGKISIWTKERIIEESKKYTSKHEFALMSPTAYRHAIKDKSVFLEMPWLVEKKKPEGWWKNKIRVMEEGQKYKTRTAFSKGSYSAWKIAKQMGWIEEMTWFKSNQKVIKSDNI